MKLSVTLATFNEAENIGRCLTSVAEIADEIVIVDGESTDETVKIAKEYKAKVISEPNKPNFHINKQMANDAADGEWILQLDADEEITPALATEIRKVVVMSDEEREDYHVAVMQEYPIFGRQQHQLMMRDGAVGSNDGPVVGYFISRKNYFMGTYLVHGGVYPDGVIRLFKADKGHLPAKDVHEQYHIDGKISWLVEPMLHHDSPTFERYLARNSRYSSMFARQMEEQGQTISLGQGLYFMVGKPVMIFFSLYIRHAGFKDGLPGLVWAYFSAQTWMTAYIKYWEMKRG